MRRQPLFRVACVLWWCDDFRNGGFYEFSRKFQSFFWSQLWIYRLLIWSGGQPLPEQLVAIVLNSAVYTTWCATAKPFLSQWASQNKEHAGKNSTWNLLKTTWMHIIRRSQHRIHTHTQEAWDEFLSWQIHTSDPEKKGGFFNLALCVWRLKIEKGFIKNIIPLTCFGQASSANQCL